MAEHGCIVSIVMNIILALVAEHRLFLATFASIEAALPSTRRVASVRRLARDVEAMLGLHARAEEDLVLLSLEQLPKHQAWCRTFQRQHQEIDSNLTQALVTKELATAKRQLRQAFQYSRRHFAYEERKVFPLLQKWIARDILEKLGRIWKHRQNVLLA